MSKTSRPSVKTLSGSKKAQGLSLNTIIIAIIVLIVLVVLVMIFTGYFGKIFTPGVSSCASSGGSCVLASADCKDTFGNPGHYTVTKDCHDVSGAPPDPTHGPNAVCCQRGQ